MKLATIQAIARIRIVAKTGKAQETLSVRLATGLWVFLGRSFNSPSGLAVLVSWLIFSKTRNTIMAIAIFESKRASKKQAARACLALDSIYLLRLIERISIS